MAVGLGLQQQQAAYSSQSCAKGLIEILACASSFTVHEVFSLWCHICKQYNLHVELYTSLNQSMFNKALSEGEGESIHGVRGEEKAFTHAVREMRESLPISICVRGSGFPAMFAILGKHHNEFVLLRRSLLTYACVRVCVFVAFILSFFFITGIPLRSRERRDG
jgi:hypothetical protein